MHVSLKRLKLWNYEMYDPLGHVKIKNIHYIAVLSIKWIL